MAPHEQPQRPLTGLTVVEFEGIGPGPHAAAILAALGARVITIARPAEARWPATHAARRVRLDLKDAEGLAQAREIIAGADALIEGFRPGVMERLGLGPEPMLESDPRLVYGRITGWGQEGPLAPRAGHDINYISITGALHAIGLPDAKPVVPLNLVGDFGGGSMFLVAGLLSALWERERTGRGRVVDAAIVDGTLALSHTIWQMRAQGRWSDDRGVNLLDGAAPYYDTYACADGRFVAVGAIEPQFYREFLDVLGLSADDLPDREDRGNWPALRAVFAQIIKSATRDEWAHRAADRDACLTPVLSFDEAAGHPHNAARRSLSAPTRQKAVLPRLTPLFSHG